MKKQKFVDYVKEKQTVYGVFCKTNDPLVIEALANAGFDYVILDNEHGPNSPRETLSLIHASEANNIYPIVRVGKLSDIEIQRILDLSPAGVQIPQIQNKGDAEKSVKFTKFSPLGMRGLCKYVRGGEQGGRDKTEMLNAENKNAVIIHIEGKEGVENIDEILEFDGIDIIFIGPYDLSQSLGIPGEVNNEKVVEKIKEVVNKCKEKGKLVGTFVDDAETAKKYRDLGINYIAYSVDLGIIRKGSEDFLRDVKKA